MSTRSLLITVSLVVVVVLVGAVALVFTFKSHSRPQGSANIEITTLKADLEEAGVETTDAILIALLEPKLSGLRVADVHQLIEGDILQLVAKNNQWVEEDLYLALEPLVDVGIAMWLESEIRSISQSEQYIVTNRQIRDLRDYFYLKDWLAFMVYYEIAFVKGEGVVVTP